ncbi:TPA: glycosyltransferase [Vibrio vulnificus]|uniref:glycosyltransferase n=2 Tax=Vibrio vulnificus TaxID=672 RepID=UPI000D464F94|nr:glycosyltransferase [Vibrio vulnificus]EHZ7344617.1 glycosyltransferase [Vibrio vulnificus]EID4425926.1 glycosyltransferase [Vibrio vulnificus]EJT0554798.1 glycosyltransferase [Vibrio vulnificus]ELE1962579.1 glycosyltransferase [Vibrio vulnificus]ELL0597543.1 glycosyltransferase [Vibrio vulnificus]
MKIALVMAHGQVHNRKGGGHSVFFAMANHFSQKHQVMAIYDDARQGLPLYSYNSSVELVNLAIPIHFPSYKLVKVRRELIRASEKLLGFPKNYNALTKMRQELVADALKGTLNAFQPDICIAFNMSDLRSIALATVPTRTFPIITMCHTDTHRVFPKLASYERDIVKHSDVFQVLLDEYQAPVKRLTSAPVVTIGNVIPQLEDSSTCTEPKLVYIARLEENKRQHKLIEAIAKVPKEVRNGWILHLFGNVANEGYVQGLKRLIASKQLTEVVKIEGVTDQPYAELLNSSICCFPSAFEGFGLALGEAMAAGLPCVAFDDCSGLSRQIKHGHTGYLESSVDSMADTLSELMQNRELRLTVGQQAKESVRRYSAEHIWSKWETLLEETIRHEKK